MAFNIMVGQYGSFTPRYALNTTLTLPSLMPATVASRQQGICYEDVWRHVSRLGYTYARLESSAWPLSISFGLHWHTSTYVSGRTLISYATNRCYITRLAFGCCYATTRATLRHKIDTPARYALRARRRWRTEMLRQYWSIIDGDATLNMVVVVTQARCATHAAALVIRRRWRHYVVLSVTFAVAPVNIVHHGAVIAFILLRCHGLRRPAGRRDVANGRLV